MTLNYRDFLFISEESDSEDEEEGEEFGTPASLVEEHVPGLEREFILVLF